MKKKRGVKGAEGRPKGIGHLAGRKGGFTTPLKKQKTNKDRGKNREGGGKLTHLSEQETLAARGQRNALAKKKTIKQEAHKIIRKRTKWEKQNRALPKSVQKDGNGGLKRQGAGENARG